MTRTVEDAARILEVIAGPDPADPLTAASAGKVPEEGYAALLSRDALRGARIGVLRTVSDTETADPEIHALFETALRDLAALGAEVVDGLELPGLFERQDELWCNTFRHDLDAYLATREGTPFATLEEIVASGLYAPYIEERLQRSLTTPPPEEQEPPCLGVEEDPRRAALLAEVVALMDAHDLDALAYPSWSNPPRKIGDLESPHGNNSPLIAPHTGQPAITVPMGFTAAGLPAGLQLLGRRWGDADLLRFAYAYEQATHHRRPPEGFGPLPP
jgi:amidase